MSPQAYLFEACSLGLKERFLKVLSTVLLGFCDEVAEYLPSKEEFEIMYGFVKIYRSIDFVAEGKKRFKRLNEK